MRQRVVVRPVAERRPADGVVTGRLGAGEKRLEYGAASAGTVVGAVDERVRHAVRLPRATAARLTTEELERHHVQVGVDVALGLRVRRRALELRSVDLRLDLRPVCAAA